MKIQVYEGLKQTVSYEFNVPSLVEFKIDHKATVKNILDEWDEKAREIEIHKSSERVTRVTCNNGSRGEDFREYAIAFID